MTDPLWYKDAVIYQLHVKSFFDSNNDGVGDFGLLQKLDYIRPRRQRDWLLPFYRRRVATTAMTSATTVGCIRITALADFRRWSPGRTRATCASPSW